MAGNSIAIAVLTSNDVPALAADVEWDIAAAALAPTRLLAGAADQRWITSFVVAMRDGVAVGLLQVRQWRGKDFTTTIHDPVAVAPTLFRSSARGANSYLLIGGTELIAGVVVRTKVPTAEAACIVRALADAAFEEARSRDLIGAALYVRDGQITQFGVGRATAQVDEFASLAIVGAADDDAYLTHLNSSRRSVVVRDWRQLAANSLRCEEVAAAEVADEAAPLVVNVKQRHGLFDHHRLAAMRLRQWTTEPLGERVAFVVRDRTGLLLAVCFGCRYGDVLEMYEIGLQESSPLRHLAYVEAMVYGPRRYAVRVGCRQLLLGLGASRPKDLRGAHLVPVWAVRDCEER